MSAHIQWRCKADHRKRHDCEAKTWRDYEPVTNAVDAKDFMAMKAQNSPHFEFRIKPGTKR